MFDFRLKVFYTVAKRLNFTKAAAELFISQPAVTKHIQELEAYYKLRLFERNGNKVSLTLAGKILLKHANVFFETYQKMEQELSGLIGQQKGTLRIGASTTIAQYVLPAVLASFRSQFRDIQVNLTINNTEQIERLLQEREIELGITEGHTKNNLFTYVDFLKDEIVLVSRIGHPILRSGTIKMDQLTKIPLVLREPGSGTLEVIAFELKQKGIKLAVLNNEITLGSAESIKAYLLHSDCLAFMSIYSVKEELRNKTMSIIDVEELTITRDFFIVKPQGEIEGHASLFLKFMSHYNFRLL